MPFEQEALQQHNKHRSIHAAPPMTLDKTMCQQAAAYATKLANMGTLMHAPKAQRSGQGENLSMGCSTNAGQTVKEAVENWYEVHFLSYYNEADIATHDQGFKKLYRLQYALSLKRAR